MDEPNCTIRHLPPREGRRWGKALAFFSVALMVAAAVHGAFLLGSFQGAGEEGTHGGATASYEGPQDPAVVLQRLEADLAAIAASGLVDAEALVAEARYLLDEAALEAESHITVAFGAAEAALESALAATGDLPELPVDYIPGAPVGDHVGAVTAPVYEVVGFGDLGLAELEALLAQWKAEASDLVPREGALPAPVAEAIAEQESFLFDDPELNALLWGFVDAADPTLKPLLRENVGTVLGAGDVVDPDEEGALQAMQYVESMLDAGEALVAFLEQHLETAAAHQDELVGVVESQLSVLEDTAASLEQQVLSDLEQNVDALLAAAPAAEQEILAAAEAYIALVRETRDRVVADLDGTIEGQVERVRGAGDDASRILLDAAADVEGQVQVASAAVDAAAAAAVATLEDLGAARGIDVAGAVDEARDLAFQVQADLRSDADASVRMLQDAAAELVGDAEALAGDAAALAEPVRAALQAASREAVEHAQAAAGFGVDVVREQTERLLEAHLEAAAAAVGDVHALAAQQRDSLVDRALELNDVALGIAGTASGLASGVSKDVLLMVDEDLEYILKVAEDYAARGPIDVDGDAERWFAVHEALTDLQQTVAFAGASAEGKAGMLKAQFEVVRGELLGVVGGLL